MVYLQQTMVRVVCSALIAMMCAALSARAEHTGILKAAAQRVDMTPADPSQLTNQWGVPFSGVHDKTYARVLVVSNGASSAVMVSMDTVEVSDATEWVKRIARETGISVTNILLTATHDHNAPIVGMVDASGMHPAGPGGAAFLAKLQEDLIAAIKQCQASLQPARLGIDTGKSYINTNRDLRDGRGSEAVYPSDKTVWVMKVESLSGEPIAVLMNYAVHGTIIGMQNNLLTGEVTGAAERTVEQAYGDKLVALYVSSAAGDQGPIVSAPRDNPSDFEAVNVLGKILGNEVVKVSRNMNPQSMLTTGRIWGEELTLSCPGQKDPGGNGPAVATEDAGVTSFKIGLLMIDKIAITHVEGEVVTRIYQEVRERSPFRNTLMFTLANRRIGYIVDDAAYEQGKGEARVSALKKGCGETAIVNGLQELFGQY
jgi:hypothetical protein